MFKIYTILLIFTSFFWCSAQNVKKTDSTSIVSYADKMVVKINVDTQTDIYRTLNRQDGSNLTIAPNNNYRLFVSLDYQFLGLSIGFAPTFFAGNNDDDLKGESSFTDFRFRGAFGPWVQGFQYSRIKGYYIENTGAFFPGWRKGIDPYLQIPDLTTQIFGLSTSYNFNPNFSFRNILYQTEWQKKSAGSFIPTLFYSYDQFSYSLGAQKVKEDVFPIRLALAYYYTLVMNENWFVGANLSPSLGVRITKNTLTNGEGRLIERNSFLTHTLEGGLQLGYASEKVIFGAGFTFDVNGYNQDQRNVVENDKIYGLIYFGYRFETPTFIQKAYNKCAKKWGL